MYYTRYMFKQLAPNHWWDCVIRKQRARATDVRIHDKSQNEQTPDHADVHLSRGLRHAVVQLCYQIDHSRRHREIHQPLELGEVVQRWGA